MEIPSVEIVFALGSTAAANATDSICEAVAVHATTETKDSPYALKRGESIDAVTQYNVNKKTGVASFCSHGGSCYPAEALRLANCRVDRSKPSYEDGEERSYSLDFIRSKVVAMPGQRRLQIIDLTARNCSPGDPLVRGTRLRWMPSPRAAEWFEKHSQP
jgi:hypothetical protein